MHLWQLVCCERYLFNLLLLTSTSDTPTKGEGIPQRLMETFRWTWRHHFRLNVLLFHLSPLVSVSWILKRAAGLCVCVAKGEAVLHTHACRAKWRQWTGWSVHLCCIHTKSGGASPSCRVVPRRVGGLFFLFFRFVRVLWDNNKIIFYNLIGCFFLADVADLLSSALIDLWFYFFWLLDPGCRRQVGLYYLFKGYPAAHLLVLVYSVLQSCCFFIDISPAFLIAIAFHYFSY